MASNPIETADALMAVPFGVIAMPLCARCGQPIRPTLNSSLAYIMRVVGNEWHALHMGCAIDGPIPKLRDMKGCPYG